MKGDKLFDQFVHLMDPQQFEHFQCYAPLDFKYEPRKQVESQTDNCKSDPKPEVPSASNDAAIQALATGAKLDDKQMQVHDHLRARYST
jgi:hypothetical protein